MGCLTSRLPTWLQKSCLLLCDWLDSPRAGCLCVCASRTCTCSATLVTALRICRHVLMSDPAQKPFAATAQWHPTVLPYFAAAFGPGGLDALSAALCRPPLSNSFRINTKRITLAVGVLRCVYHHAQPSLFITWTAHHVQDALGALSANTSNTQDSQESSWSSHPQVPDIVVQHGSGPHNVIYEDTKGIRTTP